MKRAWKSFFLCMVLFGVMVTAFLGRARAEGGSVILTPSALSMIIGDTYSIQALDSSGQPVTGLTWTSSNAAVVSLSTDDPPVLTALAAGQVTISAGGASASVTVFSGSLPTSTVVWSDPGNGSGVSFMVPAVPSPSGVADVFAFQGDGNNVQAIMSNGMVAWTGDVSLAMTAVPDFNGGLVLANFAEDNCCALASIVSLNGTTGQPGTAYTPNTSNGPVYLASSESVVPGTDGTIFTLQTMPDNNGDGSNMFAIVGIDPSTGAQKFSQALSNCEYSGYDCLPQELIVAGDGYAYAPYVYQDDNFNWNLMLLRVDSAGDTDTIPIQQYGPPPPGSGVLPAFSINLISDADTGVVLTWEEYFQGVPDLRKGPLASLPSGAARFKRSKTSVPTVKPRDGSPSPVFGMAITTGTSVSLANGPFVAGQDTNVAQVLQAQDGSFFGSAAAL